MKTRIFSLTTSFVLALSISTALATRTIHAQCGCVCMAVCNNICDYECFDCGLIEGANAARACCAQASGAMPTGACLGQ